MIPEVYFFGTRNGKPTSHPKDHTASFFTDFISHSYNTSQIIVHREDRFLYYGYVRRLNKNNYFGICICFDRILNDMRHLFGTFDNVLVEIARDGKIIHLDSSGNISWTKSAYAEENVALNEYAATLCQNLNLSGADTSKLPPKDLSIAITDWMDLSLESSKEDIENATKRYSNIYIARTNHEIERLTSYNHIIRTKDVAIANLRKQLDEQKEKNAKLLRKKNQFTGMVILLVILIATGAGLLMYKNNLDHAENRLSDARDEISHNESKIKEQKERIRQLESEQEKLKTDVANLNEFKENTAKTIPLIISDISVGNTDSDGNIETDFGHAIYSGNTMYLTPRITYQGLSPGKDITLYVKLYRPNGELSHSDTSPSGFSYSKEIRVNSGNDNTVRIGGWGNSSRGHWSSGIYRFEIWYNNMCLRSKTFSIYN